MDARNFTFMFYGFTVAWLVIMIYVISIAVRERRLRQELDRVKRMIEQAEPGRSQDHHRSGRLVRLRLRHVHSTSGPSGASRRKIFEAVPDRPAHGSH